jgi:hypothetical protein
MFFETFLHLSFMRIIRIQWVQNSRETLGVLLLTKDIMTNVLTAWYQRNPRNSRDYTPTHEI